MSDYERVLNEMIWVLQGTDERPGFKDTPSVLIERSPEQFAEHDKLDPKVRTRVRIDFKQDRFGTDENDTSMLVGAPDMDRIMYFQLSIESRKKYGEFAGLHVLEIVQRMLLGMRTRGLGGELYAFAGVEEEYRDNIWYYRAIMRYKELPMGPLYSFKLNGDEDTGYRVTEVNFEPSQINVLDGQTTGYLRVLVDEEGNYVTTDGTKVIIIKDY